MGMFRGVLVKWTLVALLVSGVARAEAVGPVTPDPSDWPRSPMEEARWFIAELERSPEVAAIREAYRRGAGAAWAKLDEELAKLPTPDVRLEHAVQATQPDRGVGPDELLSFDLGESIARALYSHLARQARREALRFLLRELAGHVCRGTTERLLSHGCTLARGSTPAIDALQMALRKDLVALPGRLVELAANEGALPREMVCALSAVDHLSGQLTTSDPARTAIAWVGAVLRHPPCRGALGPVDEVGRPCALEAGLRSARLLAAVASPGRTPDAAALLSETTRVLRGQVGLPHVPSDALERAEDRVAAIDLLLTTSQDLARERWRLTRAALVAAIADAKRASAHAFSEAHTALIIKLEELLARTPLPALAGPVLEALGDVRAPGGARDMVRAASRLLAALVTEARGQLPAGTRAAVRAAQGIADALFAGDYLLAIDRLLEVPELTGLAAIAPLLPFARLVAGLAAAKDQAEVDAIITSFAAPSDTWEARREATLVTISGQLGLGATHESFVGRDDAGLALGLVAPVGVDISFPLGASSLALMLQLFDLGAVGTARTAPGEGESVEPRLGLVQVLAPGLRLGWGIGDSPLVLSASVDLVPALRTVDGEATTVWRAGLALTIDLPLVVLGRP